jgi:ABC-2 type transport system permease protein
MSRVLSSEWRKLRATPAMWWLLAGVVLLGVAHTLVGMSQQSTLTSTLSLRRDLAAIATGSILICIAGIIGMAGEFRFGQADQTFISEPRRGRVVAAKLLLFSAVGAAFGLVASVAVVSTTALWWAGHAAGLDLGSTVIWQSVAGQVASAVLFGALGVVIGAIARSQVRAIVVTLVYLALLEPIAAQASTAAGSWLPGRAADALRHVPAGGLLSMGGGAAVLCAWIAALMLVALWRTAYTDIT